MDPAQLALMEAMSELSEEAYCAGWMEGLEYALWRLLTEGPGRYGRLDASSEQLEHLRALSDACGGWVAFDSELGEVFVPLEAWRKTYAENVESKAHLLR